MGNATPKANGAKYRQAPVELVAEVLAQREISPEGCWLWPGRTYTSGYGVAYYKADGRRVGVAVHRLIYTHLVGDPGDDKELDHTCHDPDRCKLDNKCPHRRCFNPEHLEPVTSAENGHRSGSASGINFRKTHCDDGHELTPENMNVYRGMRRCKPCHREKEAARRAAKRVGVVRLCERCGADITSRSGPARYCEACNPPSWRGSAERTAAKRSAGRACERCGADITDRHGNAAYCEACNVPHWRWRQRNT